MSKFIPIYEFAEKEGMSKQNVYRLVRESRFDPKDVRVETITVERIRIREDAKPLPPKRLSEKILSAL